MKDVLDTIKQLSKTDEKNLTQKTLKLGEEFGELAKAILPYENAFATTHRFVTTSKILEEVVDTLLCSLSIAYELGYNDDDIRDMMIQKCLKWNRLQQANIEGRFPLPFEIHVTIRLPDEESISRFKATCVQLGVKPIVLDLSNSNHDVMTSSVIHTDNAGVYAEMKRISDGLTRAGFLVVRNKIETVPWHPAAPKELEDINDNRYFESHISIIVNDTERAQLADYCKLHLPDLHLSSNRFKRLNDEDFIQMATLRSSSTVDNCEIRTQQTFQNYLNLIIKELAGVPFLRESAVLKHVVEYAIYDTNIAHDTSWINGDNDE